MGLSEWIDQPEAQIAVIGWCIVTFMQYVGQLQYYVGEEVEETMVVDRVDGDTVRTWTTTKVSEVFRGCACEAVLVSRTRGSLTKDSTYYLRSCEDIAPDGATHTFQIFIDSRCSDEHRVKAPALESGDEFLVPAKLWFFGKVFRLVSSSLEVLWFMMVDLGIYAATYTMTPLQVILYLTVWVCVTSAMDLCMTIYVERSHFTFDNSGDNNEGSWLNLMVELDNVTKDNDLGEYSVEALNVYEDMSSNIPEYGMRFLGQAMLMVMVVISLAEGSEVADDAESKILGFDRTVLFFACSVVVQLMAVTQVSKSFYERWGWWMCMLNTSAEMCTESHRSVISERGNPEEGALDTKRVEYDRNGRINIGWATVLPRFIMSFVINAVCIDLVFAYTPLVLMSSGSAMDFAKDTFAIAFIVTLDDLPEPRKLYVAEPRSFQRSRATSRVHSCQEGQSGEAEPLGPSAPAPRALGRSEV
ncbi:unnamed protein product [Prorocentrum cordatum]|uniref:Uncharacterized protein n=1 Tax=Prorocentrum cordatum TaxID=2364126 RepID=A0ABN9R6K1_9DINO|nr:unnamed protein product [Polarella glacialis]